MTFVSLSMDVNSDIVFNGSANIYSPLSPVYNLLNKQLKNPFQRTGGIILVYTFQ